MMQRFKNKNIMHVNFMCINHFYMLVRSSFLRSHRSSNSSILDILHIHFKYKVLVAKFYFFFLLFPVV